MDLNQLVGRSMNGEPESNGGMLKCFQVPQLDCSELLLAPHCRNPANVPVGAFEGREKLDRGSVPVLALPDRKRRP